MKKSNIAAMTLAAFITLPVFAVAPVTDATNQPASNAELLKRIDELTRVMTIRNRMQVRFQSQLDVLGDELNEMRGSIEVFSNQLEQIENRQRNLYQMLDERQTASATPTNKPTVVATEASKGEGSDKAAYESALALVLNDKRYSQAITAFEAFVVDYPTSESVPNAQYWLGQLLYREKKRSEAKAAFLVVINDYPSSNKRADALFKTGIIEEYAGAIDSAKSFYQKAISEYPSSSAAGLAAKRLKGL